MYRFLLASFAVIAQHIPNRTILKKTPLADVAGVFVVSFFFSVLAYIFPFPPLTPEETPLSPWVFLALVIVSTMLLVVVTRFMINRYTKDKFSLRETFALNVLLSTGSGIALWVFGLLGIVLGEGFVMPYWIVSAIAGLYMLFITQQTISKTAAISRSDAVMVIVGPLLAIIALWLVFTLSLVAISAVGATLTQ